MEGDAYGAGAAALTWLASAELEEVSIGGGEGDAALAALAPGAAYLSRATAQLALTVKALLDSEAGGALLPPSVPTSASPWQVSGSVAVGGGAHFLPPLAAALPPSLSPGGRWCLAAVTGIPALSWARCEGDVFTPAPLPPLLPHHRARSAAAARAGRCAEPQSIVTVGFGAGAGGGGGGRAGGGALALHGHSSANDFTSLGELLSWSRGAGARGSFRAFQGLPAPLYATARPATPTTHLLLHTPPAQLCLPSPSLFLAAAATSLSMAGSSAGDCAEAAGSFAHAHALRALACGPLATALAHASPAFAPLTALLRAVLGGCLLPHTRPATLLLLVPRPRMSREALGAQCSAMVRKAAAAAGGGGHHALCAAGCSASGGRACEGGG